MIKKILKILARIFGVRDESSKGVPRVRFTPAELLPPFEFVGTLYNKEENIVVQLYGRERYRDRWDYYILFNGKNFTQTTIHLKITTFLENEQAVFLDIFGKEFVLYKNDSMKFLYVPPNERVTISV